MYPYDTVIFDLDGTLLNTLQDLADSTNYALALQGMPARTLEEVRRFVGNGVRRLIERVLPEGLRTPEKVDELLAYFKEYYDSHLHVDTVPYPGIPELLTELTRRDIKVAVASNKYQSAVDRLIGHFFPDIPWAAVEGQKEGFPTKPDPSIVFEILSLVPTPKSEVLYVGDSGVDMETARRACVDSVGVTWGFRPLEELLANHADQIAGTPNQILRLAI